MRSLYIVTIAFLALTAGYLIWQTILGERSKPPTVSSELSLLDLPSRYCPTEAKAVTNLDSLTEQTARVLPITNCRTVSLAPFAAVLEAGNQLYLKIPSALPFTVSQETIALGYAPELGDVDGNGVIDQVDEAALIEQLTATTTLPTLDLTGDGRVDVEDLALVRLHQGVGATVGPDGDRVNWNQIK